MDFWFYYYAAVVFIFGLVFGSFLNCVAMRLVRHEDFIHGRSHCMECGHELGVADLIPVASWVFSGGKCRYCKTKVSARYPITELVLALLWLGIYTKFGISIESLRDIILVSSLFTISLVDLESYEIPDGILIIASAAWMVTAFAMGYGILDVLHHAFAGLLCGAVMLAFSLVMDRLLGKESMGGGDIKLYALLGLYEGYIGAYIIVMLSCIIGLLFAAIIRQRKIPFGPSIAAAGYIVLLFGDAISNWYLSLF